MFSMVLNDERILDCIFAISIYYCSSKVRSSVKWLCWVDKKLQIALLCLSSHRSELNLRMIQHHHVSLKSLQEFAFCTLTHTKKYLSSWSLLIYFMLLVLCSNGQPCNIMLSEMWFCAPDECLLYANEVFVDFVFFTIFWGSLESIH